jgi:hypothetical protein
MTTDRVMMNPITSSALLRAIILPAECFDLNYPMIHMTHNLRVSDESWGRCELARMPVAMCMWRTCVGGMA